MMRKLPKIRRKSMALVVVLMILVLVTALVLSFFSIVTSELTSSKTYAGGEQAKQLSDSVVQLVISQIGQATITGASAPGLLTWASQPGMIRTFNDSGNPANFYKLYSAPQMIVSGAAFMASVTSGTVDQPLNYQAWSTAPALYTDLNQPQLALDPAGSIVTNSGTYSAVYPIMDPTADSAESTSGTGVEGFSIFNSANSADSPPTGYTSAPTGYSGGYPIPANYNPVTSPNPAPMPVQWLYVLRNGALAPPDAGSSGTTVTFTTYNSTAAAASQVSSSNPIVGRVAFWTDDETCKLNINTASEGTCFDVPRGTIQSEISMANAQPVQSEFQRIPGHPAMTCLSPALGWISGFQRSATTGTFGSSTAPYSTAEAYYDLAPRVNYQDSAGADTTTQGGSVQTIQLGYSGTSYAVTPDADRLYDSVDELVFHPGTLAAPRISNPQPQTGATYTPPVITKPEIEKTRFFLTASSRAPDTTVFNTPRIGMWPMQMDGTGDPKDSLLRFCSSLGSTSGTANPYYFQRYNENVSYNNNINQMNAWSGGTPPYTSLPTGVPSSMSTTADMYAIPRNEQIYEYLQNLTSQKIPGFAGSFGGASNSKWGPVGRDQVLTEMFDWIRGNLDQSSSGLTGGYQYPFAGGYYYASNMVAPIAINTGSAPFSETGGGATKGFGHCNTVVQAAIVFFATSATNAILSGSSTPPTTSPYPPLATTQMQAVLLLMPFNPSPALSNWGPFFLYDVSFGGGFKITTNAGSASFTDAVTRHSAVPGSKTPESQGNFPLPGWGYSFTFAPGYAGTGYQSDWKTTSYSGAPHVDSNYPYFTAPVTVAPTQDATNTSTVPSFAFTGGTLTLRIRNGIGGVTADQAGVTSAALNSAGNEVYQTVSMNFPSFTSVVPQAIMVQQVVTSSTNIVSGNPVITTSTNYVPFPSWDARISANQSGNGDHLGFRSMILDGDIVRAVEVDPNGPSKGDYRLIAGLPTVSSAYFHPNPDYVTAAGSPVTVTPYISSRVDQYNNSTNWAVDACNATDTSGTNLNQLAAARLGRFAHSLRVMTTGASFVNPDCGYGVGNGAISENGSTFSTANRNNASQPPFAGSNISAWPSVASTVAGSGTNTVGIPNPGGLVAGITYACANNIGGNSAIDTPVAAHGMTAALMSNNSPGDWDNGYGLVPDGPYINAPDAAQFTQSLNINADGYWGIGGGVTTTGAGYAPNRQVASPVMFGSLPTPGVYSSAAAATGTLAPWQTLLFCPNPPAGYNHPGWGWPVNAAAANTAPTAPFNTPPDYLMLDLFTMPVVEPYAISEPLSTAGRVNLNYQIMPFTFVRRDTAVRGVLKSMEIGAIPNTATAGTYTSSSVTAYKLFAPSSDPYIQTTPTRFTLNLDETKGTLAGFENKFGTGDVFRSAGDICSIFLVPNDTTTNPTYSTISNVSNGWWSNYKLTGDNLRESPYNQIYPRVTTKSNTFTIHYKVQIIKPAPTTASNAWNESTGQVVAEYRGSTLIERYVDPSDPNLPDFISRVNSSASPTLALSGTNYWNLDNFYKFRVINEKKF